MRAWLLAQPSAKEADEILVRSLTSSRGVTLKIRTSWRFPEVEPAYEVVEGYDLGPLEDGSDLAGAAADIQAALVGPTKRQAEEWIAVLSVACIRRGETEATNAIAFALYTSEIQGFPADIVRDACVDWARKNKWFPALAELLALCIRSAARRRVLAEALRRVASVA